jgi:hypothetical protein
MKTVKCCRCEERFGLEEETLALLKRSQQRFHCPWGHPQHFPAGKSELEKMEEALDAERRARQRAEQNAAYEASRAARIKASRNAYKGQVTRLRTRAKAGICPCCNRHFEQLERHMAAKHPDFQTEAKEPTEDE